MRTAVWVGIALLAASAGCAALAGRAPSPAPAATPGASAAAGSPRAPTAAELAARFEDHWTRGRLQAALAVLAELRQLQGPATRAELDPLELELCVELGWEQRARAVAARVLAASADPQARHAAEVAVQKLDELARIRQGADLELARRDLRLADELLARREFARAAALYEDAWQRSRPNPMALVLAGLALEHDPAAAQRCFERALIDAEAATRQKAAPRVMSGIDGMAIGRSHENCEITAQYVEENDEDDEPSGEDEPSAGDAGGVDDGSPATSPEERSCFFPEGDELLRTRWQGDDLFWVNDSWQHRLFSGGTGAVLADLLCDPVFADAERASYRPVFWRQEVPRIVVRRWEGDGIELCDPVTDAVLGKLAHPIDRSGDYGDQEGVVVFSADRSRLLAGATDGVVRLWDARSRRLVRAFSRPKLGAVRDLALSPTGRLVAATDRSLAVVWDAKTGAVVDQWLLPQHTVDANPPNEVPPGAYLEFSPDESGYVVATIRHAAWRPLPLLTPAPPTADSGSSLSGPDSESEAGPPEMILQQVPDGARGGWGTLSAELSADRSTMAFGSKYWGAVVSGEGMVDELPGRPVFAPYGLRAVATSDGSGSAQISDHEVMVLLGQRHEWRQVERLVPDVITAEIAGARLLVRGYGFAVVLRLPSFEWERSLPADDQLATLSPEGTLLAGIAGGRIRIVDLERGRLIATVPHQVRPRSRLHLGEDGTLAVEAMGAARLWKPAENWMKTRKVDGFQMLSLDGTRMAVAVPTKWRHGVEIRDVATNQRLGRIEGNEIEVSPNGRYAICELDLRMQLVDVDTGRQDRLPLGAGDFRFSADGRWLFAVSRQPNETRFWRLGETPADRPLRLASGCDRPPFVGGNHALYDDCPYGKATFFRLDPLVKEGELKKGSAAYRAALGTVGKGAYSLSLSEAALEIEVGETGTSRILWRLVQVENKEALILLGDDEVRLLGPQGSTVEPLLCCEVGPYCLPFASCRDRFVRAR
ncbi:MAG: hypothetical protein JW751_13175 [Polyangiaceae bacterium]|nr:hypothetical protein [Polyangiaceae bacterium]